MPVRKDVSGQIFGKLTAIADVGATKHGKRIWLCNCDCGGTAKVILGTLTSGSVKSCGCLKKVSAEARRKDIAGQRFGLLVAVEDSGRSKRGNRVWRCLCDCGIIAEVARYSLVSGNTRSCGCLVLDVRTKHGKARTREYSIWSQMKLRCNRHSLPRYARYGGRGISVCERWKSFENFYEDMGVPPTSEHTLDRIDNDGNYEPGNCRWATPEVQCRNKIDNRTFEIDGVCKCITDWIRFNALVSPRTVYRRLERGLSIQQALGLEEMPS